MEPYHFEIATRDVSFKTEGQRKAVEAVLVGGMGVENAAQTFKVPQSTVSTSIRLVRKALDAWITKNRLIKREFILHAEDVETVDRLEQRTLDPILKADEIETAPRKKRAERYAAKKQKNLKAD